MTALPFRCDICGRRYQDLGVLGAHLRMRHPEPMKPISDEARHLLMEAVTREVRQLEEMYERAPIGSAYRDDLRARMGVLTDRYYEVQRAPKLESAR